MWSRAWCWLSGALVFSMACGGMAAPPPPVMAASEWRSAHRRSDRPLVVYTDPGEIPRLELATGARDRLPLEHTHVKATLTGFVAEVEVTQTYKNPHGRPIEAVYVFP